MNFLKGFLWQRFASEVQSTGTVPDLVHPAAVPEQDLSSGIQISSSYNFGQYVPEPRDQIYNGLPEAGNRAAAIQLKRRASSCCQTQPI
jgi:hypothetical protein